ncbi:MAG: TfoX/Sxy family protein [Bauldia sp.]|nr:TfoX/Sxy family protein [Bauldia sp.]
MAISPGFKVFLDEQFAPLPGVTIRKMFGGLGVFRDGIMFAMSVEDTLYLRCDGERAADFEAEGSAPVVFKTHTGKDMPMPYWRAPERLFDEPEAFRDWAERAFADAWRMKVEKPARKPRKARAAG